MHYIIELFVILTLLIIPPFFSNQVPKLTIPTFSWKDILIFGTIALYCFIRVKDEKTKDYPINYFKLEVVLKIDVYLSLTFML